MGGDPNHWNFRAGSPSSNYANVRGTTRTTPSKSFFHARNGSKTHQSPPLALRQRFFFRHFYLSHPKKGDILHGMSCWYIGSMDFFTPILKVGGIRPVRSRWNKPTYELVTITSMDTLVQTAAPRKTLCFLSFFLSFFLVLGDDYWIWYDKTQ